MKLLCRNGTGAGMSTIIIIITTVENEGERSSSSSGRFGEKIQRGNYLNEYAAERDRVNW